MIFSSTPPIPSRRNSSSTFLYHHIKVDFMGNVNYFLGTYFNWITHKDGNISVHLSQLAFIEFAPHCFSFHTLNKVPNMTPYCSGLPIASIPPVYPLDPVLPFIKQVYQITFGCINWLYTCTFLDIYLSLAFIAFYRNAHR